MDNKCIRLEIELENFTIKNIHNHMKKSGLEFNDALIEILEMSIDSIEGNKKVRG